MEHFGVCGKLIAHPGKRDELVDVLLTAAEELGKLAECKLYVVNIIDDEPDAVWVTELWTSRGAHASSLENDSVRELILRGRPLIAGFDQQVRLKPVGGKGLD